MPIYIICNYGLDTISENIFIITLAESLSLLECLVQYRRGKETLLSLPKLTETTVILVIRHQLTRFIQKVMVIMNITQIHKCQILRTYINFLRCGQQ